MLDGDVWSVLQREQSDNFYPSSTSKRKATPGNLERTLIVLHELLSLGPGSSQSTNKLAEATRDTVTLMDFWKRRGKWRWTREGRARVLGMIALPV